MECWCNEYRFGAHLSSIVLYGEGTRSRSLRCDEDGLLLLKCVVELCNKFAISGLRKFALLIQQREQTQWLA